MKIAHIADTHFGKDLKKINFADVDQRDWMERFLAELSQEGVEVVVIAGDIYDDKVPPIKAVNLFSEFLERLNDLNITVFIIPGNHDQEDRLSANGNILKKQNIFLAPKLSKELLHKGLTLPNGTQVNFWLLPYVEPIDVRRVLDREDITNYDNAVRELLALQPVDKTQVNIVVAHQNVLSRAHARILNEDEEVVIGYSGEVNPSAFDGFDYVALGHIHAMQTVGSDRIRFAGSPLQYDFSEEGRWKGYLLVEVQDKEHITITEKELTPLHQVMVLPKGGKAGTLEELLQLAKIIPDKDKYYFKVRIKNSYLVGNAQEQLYEAFGVNNLLETEPVRESSSSYATTNAKGSTGRSLEENFALYIKDMTKEELSDEGKLVMAKILEQQQRDGFIATLQGKERDNYKQKACDDLIAALEEALGE